MNTKFLKGLLTATSTLLLAVFVGCGESESEGPGTPTGPTITLEDTDTEASEDGNSGRLTVRLSQAAAEELTIVYTVSGTATPTTDYTALTGTCTIASGSSSATIDVVPKDDSDIEGAETVVVTLQSVADYEFGTSSQTVTIADDDPYTVTLETTDGDASESGNAGMFTVRLSENAVANWPVNYTVEGDATAGVDYVTLSGTVVVPTGSDSATIKVTPNDDGNTEGNETVEVTLTRTATVTPGTPSSGTVTIADDEASSLSANIVADDTFVAEGTSGTFTINLSEPAPAGGVTIRYGVTGTSSVGSDFGSGDAPGSVNIAQGADSAVITINTADDDDDVVEGMETLILTLFGGSAGYSLGDNDVATMKIIETRTIEDLGMTFVSIPAGSFMMGSPIGEQDRDDDEGPQHQVTLTNDFWMAQTEVTIDQFRAFLLDGGSTSGIDFEYGKCPINDDELFTLRNNEFGQSGNQPMILISWHAATRYCEWLTEREQDAGRLGAGVVYRLPTEAEWEYCCRAETSTRFNFDIDAYSLHEYAWFNESSSGKTHTVGDKTANLWGLYDMHGNAQEWCHDWRGPYIAASQSDPIGSNSGSGRIIRGGGYSSLREDCRTAARNSGPPTTNTSEDGVRVVLAPPIP